MSRILAIESAAKKDRYFVRLDDGSALCVSGDVIVRFHLYTGMEPDAEMLLALAAETELQAVKERAAALIGMRPMSEHELKKKLAERGASAENAQAAAEWLRSLGALNDTEYAGTLARYYAGKGYGEARIRDEFYRRGIARELWEDALAEYSAQEGTIDRLLRSKLRSAQPDRKELKRATDALFRRGFSWDEIRGALARYEADEA